MRRGIALAVVALVLVIGGFFAFTSPPRLLSYYDRVVGGTDDVEKVAEGEPFGTHGQTLDIWARQGNLSAPCARPVVIFWYGGGWAKGDRASYAFAARALARENFIVVVPDYRKVPDVRFPAFLEDAAQAVAWARDNINMKACGDPARIVLMGHSAGAYQAVMLALDKRWLEAEGVDPCIVKAVVGLSGPYDFYPFTSERAVAAMSQWPRPAETQPITFARADAPPMLLLTSDGDETVRPKNANNLAARLRELGATAEVKNYGLLDHEEIVMALSKPFRSKGPVLADSVAFLHKHQGTATPYEGEP
jgi:acetyl esterase/lipase